MIFFPPIRPQPPGNPTIIELIWQRMHPIPPPPTLNFPPKPTVRPPSFLDGLAYDDTRCYPSLTIAQIPSDCPPRPLSQGSSSLPDHCDSTQPEPPS